MVDKCDLGKEILSREKFPCIIVGGVTCLEFNEGVGNDREVAFQMMIGLLIQKSRRSSKNPDRLRQAGPHLDGRPSSRSRGHRPRRRSSR